MAEARGLVRAGSWLGERGGDPRRAGEVGRRAGWEGDRGVAGGSGREGGLASGSEEVDGGPAALTMTTCAWQHALDGYGRKRGVEQPPHGSADREDQ